MLFRWSAVTGATFVTIAVLSWTGSGAAAGLDVSGNWDVYYSLTCDVTFDEEAAVLSAAVNCGAGAVGTLEGSADADNGGFSLFGGLGLIAVSLEGSIVDDDSLGGTFSAFPLAEAGTFEGVRVDRGSGTGLSGDWIITLTDVFSGGCTIDIEQVGVDLTAKLICESLSEVALEGTLDGSAVTLTGSFPDISDVLLEVMFSEDGVSAEGIWRVGPENPAEITGSFTATLRAGPAPIVESKPTVVSVELPDLPATVLPATGTGLKSAQQSRGIVQVIIALTMLGAFAVAGGWLAIRRRA